MSTQGDELDIAFDALSLNDSDHSLTTDLATPSPVSSKKPPLEFYFAPPEIKAAQDIFNNLLAGAPDTPKNDAPNKSMSFLLLVILYMERLRVAKLETVTSPALYHHKNRPFCKKLAKQKIHQLTTFTLEAHHLDPHSMEAICKALRHCPYLAVLNLPAISDSSADRERKPLAYFQSLSLVIEHCRLLESIKLLGVDLGQMDTNSLQVFSEALTQYASLKTFIFHTSNRQNIHGTKEESYQMLFNALATAGIQTLYWTHYQEFPIISPDPVFRMFCAALGACNLRTLRLSFSNSRALVINEPGLIRGLRSELDALLPTLSALEELERIDLSNPKLEKLDPIRFGNLCTALPMLLNLRVLNLEGGIKLNELSLDGLKHFFAALADCPELETLDLTDNNLYLLDEERFQIVCIHLARCKKLKRLDLSKNGVGKLDEKRLQMLCDALISCEQLSELIFHMSDLEALNPKCFRIFCTMLPKCGGGKLRYLSLPANNLGTMPVVEGVNRLEVLYSCLRECKTLEILFLGNNGLSKEETEFESLCNSLETLPLKCLNLHKNDLGRVPSQFTKLCATCKKIPTLEHLALPENELKSLDTNSVQQLCNVMSRLKSIDLSYNALAPFNPQTQVGWNDDSTQAFAQALKGISLDSKPDPSLIPPPREVVNLANTGLEHFPFLYADKQAPLMWLCIKALKKYSVQNQEPMLLNGRPLFHK